MRFTIRDNNPLPEGTYRCVLRSIEEKVTLHGERLLWLYEEVETGAEVPGWTSRNTSTLANPYKWAVALNPEIQNQRSWSEEDALGRQCLLVLEVVEGSKGPKNKIVEVLPIE